METGKEGQHHLVSAYVGVRAYDARVVGVRRRVFHKILGRENGQGLFKGNHLDTAVGLAKGLHAFRADGTA